MMANSESRGSGEYPAGKYSNYFQIGYNAHEFVIDFGQSYEDEGAVQYHTRVVTSPAYARELLEALRKCTASYEDTYGSLED